MKIHAFFILAAATTLPFNVCAKDAPAMDGKQVSEQFVADQRRNLASNTDGKGFGPQSPRDLSSTAGSNPVVFSVAPAYTEMNLCDIHFHKNAEHKGGAFTKYAGNGDGEGYLGGYQYSGQLHEGELAAVEEEVCPSEHGSLYPGDTIEVHYVYSTARVAPGPTLGSCFNDSIQNPQLRVEAQVYVLVNDSEARNFVALTRHEQTNGLHQAVNLPNDTGTPVQYAGSTTGPGYNEAGSPFQVTWNVRPEVLKVNLATVGEWCQGNVFEEDHAHGVRNLVTNPELLSEIR
ncbi:delta-class carbonic anhydrase [Marinobacter sp. X15-166B]|uniref:delta-class carbonic anhydrase n=1 Tax=Marinobacter sp. X15-166B TaxID=1897620 RepID=UPI00085CDB24|nr:delta-class carbonic anhydrase [Marinobacter sp. X15-166B]OEY65959.1 hypothetical protein BG841_05475 [Marinobacter sp. X15-166B]